MYSYMKKKYNKGEFLYLSHKKKSETIKTLVYFGISAAIFIMGYLSTHTKANYLTIVAVLGCLPASKSAVSMIMNLKVKGCSDKLHKEIKDRFGENTGFYNLYFTTYDKNYEIAHLFVKEMTVIGYTEKTDMDENKFEEHLKTVLLHDAIKGVNVKLYKNMDKYLERISQMQSLENEISKEESITKTLFSVSL